MPYYSTAVGSCIWLSDNGTNFLVFNQVMVTISKVMLPPNITAGTVPSNLAAMPDSKSPISLDEPINIEFTADTLPRIWSGVKSCIIVPRMITLTLSNAPCKNKNISDT